MITCTSEAPLTVPNAIRNARSSLADDVDRSVTRVAAALPASPSSEMRLRQRRRRTMLARLFRWFLPEATAKAAALRCVADM